LRKEQNILSDYPVLHFPNIAKDPCIPMTPSRWDKKKENGYVEKWASTMV
jgi:hypothetical protein